MKICVLGLGSIGLPTSLLFANVGHDVIGVDIDNKVIEKLTNEEFPFEEPRLEVIKIYFG